MAKKTKRNVYRVTWKAKPRRWWVVGQGGGFFCPHLLKSSAVKCGRAEAQAIKPSQLVVHGKNGRIQYENTYGNDPKRSKG